MADIPQALPHWLEIDLDKLAGNFAAVQRRLPPQTRLIAVVKNDAYGFGAPQCARLFVECGAAMLAVTTLEEALELRGAGIDAPVLVFLPPLPGQGPIFAGHDLTATVDSPAVLAALDGYPQVDCHIKVNTGMNRFGAGMDELDELLAQFARPDAPRLRGLYSHLATVPAADESCARRQIKLFDEMRARAAAAGFDGIICHLANSAGALRFAETTAWPQAAVRIGSALYGQLAGAKQFGIELADPFAARARVLAVRSLRRGEGVGYGQEFTAGRDMRLAVVPFGYGDGFNVSADARELTLKSSFQTMSRDVGRLVLGRYRRGVYWQGHFLPALGRIAMQTMMVDIGDLPVAVGDVVDAPMRRTAASARLPRVYLRGGEVAETRLLVGSGLLGG